MKKKIFLLKDLNKKIRNLQSRGKKIVQCHGVFDLLHIGHIKHFREAKTYGEILVVSITSDRFVNKGPNRPAFNQNLRAESLASLEYIDFVVINDNASAIPIIKSLRPNFYCKGPDYKIHKKDITGKIKTEISAVKRFGGKIIYTKEETYSSSKLINIFTDNFTKTHKSNIKEIKKKYSYEKIINIFEKIKKTKVLVIGETIIDEYNFCEALGKSGKEPTLVLRDLNKETYSGGAVAIARHLSPFLTNVSLLSMIGEKKEYLPKIKKDLPKNVNFDYIKKENSPTIIKRRFLDHISKNKVLGVYSLNDDRLNNTNEKQFQKKLKKMLRQYDMVIVSDYGHGLISTKSAKMICTNSKFLAVNAQLNASNIGFHSMRKYRNPNCVIINDRELRYELRDRNSPVTELMKKLCNDQKINNLIVTMGTQGSIFYNKQKSSFFRNQAYEKNALDKIGAGDTMLALASICLHKKLSERLSLIIGSLGAAQSVRTIGNKTPIDKIEMLKTLEHLLK
tara:strand:+ start:1650 stop:3173 length:1524 start_codon:yes stop_codon:yes gene_type:complete